MVSECGAPDEERAGRCVPVSLSLAGRARVARGLSRAGKVTVDCVGVMSFRPSASCVLPSALSPAPSSRFACRSEVAQEPSLLLVRSQERERRPWRYRSSTPPFALDVARQFLYFSQVELCSVEECCSFQLRTDGTLPARERGVNKGTH